jgi:hypothetical protein
LLILGNFDGIVIGSQIQHQAAQVLVELHQVTLHFPRQQGAVLVNPFAQVNDLGVLQVDDTVYAQNLFVRFVGVEEGHKIKIGVKESSTLIDFVTVKSYVFPYIILVWIGLIVMAFGIMMSMIHRANISSKLGAAILVLISIGLCYMFLFAG